MKLSFLKYTVIMFWSYFVCFGNTGFRNVAFITSTELPRVASTNKWFPQGFEGKARIKGRRINRYLNIDLELINETALAN